MLVFPLDFHHGDWDWMNKTDGRQRESALKDKKKDNEWNDEDKIRRMIRTRKRMRGIKSLGLASQFSTLLAISWFIISIFLLFYLSFEQLVYKRWNERKKQQKPWTIYYFERRPIIFGLSHCQFGCQKLLKWFFYFWQFLFNSLKSFYVWIFASLNCFSLKNTISGVTYMCVCANVCMLCWGAFYFYLIHGIVNKK